MRTKLARVFSVPMLALSLLCGSAVHAVAQVTETITITRTRTETLPDGTKVTRTWTETVTVEKPAS